MTRPSRSALLVAAAVLVVLGGLAVAGRWSQGQLDRDEPAPAPSRPSATTTAAPTGAVARVGDAGPVDDVAVGRDAVWAATGATVTRFDPVTGRPTATLAASSVSPPPLVGVSVGTGAVWVAVIGESLLRVDPESPRVVARLPLAPSAAAAIGAGGVWVVCCDGSDGRGRLVRVDPATNRVVVRVELPGVGNAVGAGPGGVWVRGVGGPVWRVDPAAGRVVAAVPIPGPGERPGGIAVTREAVWVSDPDNAALVRIDPRRNRLTGGRVPADGEDLTVDADGVVWATSGTRLLGLGRARVLGPRRNLHELSSVRIVALAAGPDGLWLGTPAGLFRVDREALD